MSVRPLHVMLMGAAVILSTIAPVPAFAEFEVQTFAEFEKTEWDVQDLYKQCTHKGSFDAIFCLIKIISVSIYQQLCIYMVHCRHEVFNSPGLIYRSLVKDIFNFFLINRR